MATKKSALGKVGYGKPPLKTQFKKGQSGNPKGRPKGTRNFDTDVKEMLALPVPIDREGARRKKISTQQATLWRLREKALKGDTRAMDRVIDLAKTLNADADTDVAKLRGELTPDELAILDEFHARMGLSARNDNTPNDEEKPS